MAATRTPEFFDNNFDLIRLFAAASVAFGHVLDWSIGKDHIDLVFYASFIPGVPIFFFMSGFLVSASWERSRDVAGYVANRSLRILPGLWLSLAVSVTALLLLYRAPILDNLPQFGLWLFAQTTLFQAWNPAFLRGYGTGVVNMALWTIPIEMLFYVAVPLLDALVRRAGGTLRILLPVALVSFTIYYVFSVVVPQDTETGRLASRLMLTSPLGAIGWLWIFLIGVMARAYFAEIIGFFRGKALLWIGLLVAETLFSLHVHVQGILDHDNNRIGLVNALFWSAAVLSAAYSFPGLADRLLGRHDCSYGVYIIHVPILNLLIACGLAGMQLFALTLVLVPIAALLSWRFVEHPALRWRRPLVEKLGRIIGRAP